MKKAFLVLSVLLISLCARAQTNLYVDGSMSTSGAGTSWVMAYKTLNEALNVANTGSIAGSYNIHIARGNYYPTGSQSGTNRDSAFLIARGGINLFGGYPSGGGTRAIFAYQTVLSGAIGVASSDTDNSYHVLVVAGIAAAADSVKLDGLTIRSGRANGAGNKIYNGIPIFRGSGGGMHVSQNTCRLLLDSCIISQNRASGTGGNIQNNQTVSEFRNSYLIDGISVGSGSGIFVNSDSSIAPVRFLSCAFTNNESTNGSGAGIFHTRKGGTGPGLILTNCGFQSNWIRTSNSYGGAIFDENQDCEASRITGCTFINNIAANGGAIAAQGINVSGTNNYLSGCRFNGNSATQNGGAVHMNSSAFSFRIDSCFFDQNIAGSGGGGLYALSLSNVQPPTVSRCVFTRDTALRGGAVYSDGVVNYFGDSLRLNRARMGGGMYQVNSGNSTIRHGVFSGNRAWNLGAGMYNRNSTINYIISNSLFSGNRALRGGGAMYDSSASPLIVSCTMAGDSAAQGNGIYNFSSSPNIVSSIIWEGIASMFDTAGSSPSLVSSTIPGGAPGAGNLSADPLFVLPVPGSLAPNVQGNYELIPCSPQVDQGTTISSFIAPLDLGGRTRVYGPRMDQGAFEYSGAPFPGAITGNSSGCTGNSIQLGNSHTGGIWRSSNPLIATVNGNGLVTAHSTGTDTIWYQLSRGACIDSAMKVITIGVPPAIAPIIGPDTICLNANSLMTNATGSGRWSSSNTAIVNINPNTGQVYGNSRGTATISYAVVSGPSCTTSVSKAVTVASLIPPPVSGPNGMCVGAAGSYTSTVPGGVWRVSDTNIARIDSVTGLLQSLAAGNVTVIYSIKNSYCQASGGISLRVTSFAQPTITFTGEFLFANESGAAYQWIDCANGNAPLVGETGETFTPSSNGSYAVVVSRFGCTDTSDCIAVTGLDVPGTAARAGVRVYPNPASDVLTISTGSLAADRILIRDVAGKVLQSFAPKSRETAIDISGLATGIYLVEVIRGQERFTEKVSILH